MTAAAHARAPRARRAPAPDDAAVPPVDTHRLQRAVYPMPEDVLEALTAHGVLEAYRRRPAYQQNDYVGWITRARMQATRLKRLNQMLQELARGDVYMKMRWKPRQP